MSREKYLERLEQVKAEIKKRRRKPRKLIKPLYQPRYDDVFFEGVKWLDGLAYTDNWDDD